MDYSQEATITVKVDINCYKPLDKDEVMKVDLAQLHILEIVSVQSVSPNATFVG